MRYRLYVRRADRRNNALSALRMPLFHLQSKKTEQSCWCLSFREWARDAGLLWFPALLLGGTATCLGGAHQIVRGALALGTMTDLQYGLVHVPIRYGTAGGI